MALCRSVTQLLCDLLGRKGTGREQKSSFLRKESNECMACPVSVKQRFNIAAFSSKPPPGRS